MLAGPARVAGATAPGGPGRLLVPLVLQIVTIERLYGHVLQIFRLIGGLRGP